MDFEKLVKGLERRGMEAHVFSDREALVNFLQKEIKDFQTLAFGGSITLMELGLYEKFTQMGKEVIWHWKTEPDKRGEALKKAANAEVYFSSTNAMTMDGRLVNVDGNGNRVSAMIFGIPKVIIIAGKNKIAEDLDAAIRRIRTVACPKNAKRLGANVPCTHGVCLDCTSVDRLCNITTIIEGCPQANRMIVCLIDEELGY